MNIILFEEHEIEKPLPRNDSRAVHILSVLRCRPGDTFDTGIVNGPRAKARIVSIKKNEIRLQFFFNIKDEKDELFPVILVVGMSRPQTMRKILRETTSLGVSHIMITGTDKTEESYHRSRLWTHGEYRHLLIWGAEQAFSTKIPEIQLFKSLEECCHYCVSGERIALDNYEADVSLASYTFSHNCCILAVGPEKGWSNRERNFLREQGFTLVHLGKRVLRTETACVSGITLVLAGLNLL
jgi:16S rRNA (uracil1498-N3)-methyltransferase